MTDPRQVFIGTDGGATTSKVSASGPTDRRSPPSSCDADNAGRPDAAITGWVESVAIYLADNGLRWSQVQGVGVAVAGPQQRYGVMDKGPNFRPASSATTCCSTTAMR